MLDFYGQLIRDRKIRIAKADKDRILKNYPIKKL